MDSRTRHLPDRGAPGRPVLVFDGDCGFCTTSAAWVRRRLRVSHVEPWQHLDLEVLGLTREQCEEAVQWVGADGSVVSAERAVAAVLRHAGRPWSWVGWFLERRGVRPSAGFAYRLVSRHRHRLPGGTAACRLPSDAG